MKKLLLLFPLILLSACATGKRPMSDISTLADEFARHDKFDVATMTGVTSGGEIRQIQLTDDGKLTISTTP